VALERASGKPIQEYLEDAVLQRAGMHDTRVDDPTRDDPALAWSYLRIARGWQRTWHPEDIRRASVVRNIGAMTSTLDDLVKWDRAWREPVLLDTETLKDAMKPGLLANGSTASQGWGWILGEGRRSRQLWHGGSWINFNSLIWRHLDYPVTIICLTNLRPSQEWEVTDALAEIWIGRNTWLQE
jgi:CubicO group peptidase (beta-lactamase class C family)